MCRVFKVDRSSFYHWIKQGCKIKQADEKLNELIKNIFIAGRGNYGTRRIKSRLLSLYGLIVSRRKIGTIMKDLNLSAKVKKRYKLSTTDSNHNLPIAPNILKQDFCAMYPNQKYVGDITYIPTNEGWVYLATVIDLYSRKIVGHSISDNMKTSLVNQALMMAIKRRNPPRGVIWHTDRGSRPSEATIPHEGGQYASYKHRDLCRRYGIIQSMSRKENCWDNAVAESFFHTLKTELVYQRKFHTKAEANQAIFEYIEVYYNRQRSHSANSYLSPVEFEEKMLQRETVA